MELTRWDPFREVADLTRVMDRLFEDRPFPTFRWSEWTCTPIVGLPLDVYEEPDKYVVEASLPGVKPEDVEVSVQNNTLTIAGTFNQGAPNGRRYLLRERSRGKFARALTLPAEIEADKVEARFADGVLHLTLPKAPQYQARKIAVKAND